MREVRIPSFAKINLRLDILGKRADGYHELRTIFQTVSLHDELRLRAGRSNEISLTIHGNDELAREPVTKNLAYRAVDALRHELKIRRGVEIELHKTIPSGGGLGGGSSNAAAALFGYLQLIGRKLPMAVLIELAASLGADVPIFLFGGRALGAGRGDEIYPLPDIAKLALLIVASRDIRVPTPDAFRWLNAPVRNAATLTKLAADHKLWEFCALSWSAQGNGLSNDFEKPVFKRYNRLDQIKRVLLQKGAAEASLAGSGSAVFGVFPSPTMARRAAVGFPHDLTFVCETISRDGYLRAVKGANVVR
ncbi:MAG TPA: 4-(cytidine 5'-diphospho)-2-C-methyl-D-erythritol kinase [Verrucomicrobiae bacterium]|nr:4-(cytidine 5'-diphospho)-2-C-methyl-D-erythritol kinase [Verrucomicrobiae bacterium]